LPTLFDTGLFTRHLETAYRAMYRRLAEGAPPAPILVDDCRVALTVAKAPDG
jgi:hypothetical protein